MNTVISINLAGRSYALEETGYNALKAYLAEAAKNLEGNPDKEEILKDFDLAVAEKCEGYLHAGKNVITSEEVEKIIKEMGPVETSSGTAESTEKKTGEEDKNKTTENNSRPKKLFRITEGEMVSGVCTGLGAYFNVDANIVRIIFVLLTIVTHGIGVLIYIIMIVVIPVATTPEQKSQAFGTAPITAQELLQKTKDGYSNFKNSKEWKRWKKQLQEEKRRWKNQYRNYDYNYSYTKPTYSPFHEFLHTIIGIIWIAFIIFICWFAYNHFGPAHQTFNAIGELWTHFIQSIVNHFVH